MYIYSKKCFWIESYSIEGKSSAFKTRPKVNYKWSELIMTTQKLLRG